MFFPEVFYQRENIFSQIEVWYLKILIVKRVFQKLPKCSALLRLFKNSQQFIYNLQRTDNFREVRSVQFQTRKQKGYPSCLYKNSSNYLQEGSSFSLSLSLFLIWLHDIACRILNPQLGIESRPVKVQSPNHWTTKEFSLFF